MTPGKTTTVWNACMVNCGSRCPLRVTVHGGRIVRVEGDTAGDDVYGRHQVRACLRGRAMRRRVHHPGRLIYPQKRIGRRGADRFARISWDEAFDAIAAKMRQIKAAYGNEAFYLNYGTGSIGSLMSKSWPPAATPIARLMNCYGGYLNHYNTYSSAQIKTGLSYLYGQSWPGGNPLSDIVNSKLVVFFGNNPAETRMSGGGLIHDLLVAKKKSGVKVIVVDPRYTDTAVAVADQWVPIRPGTDGALAGALAHVLITENMVDEAFVARYCVGYDERHLPAGVPSGSSYAAYILGAGPDGVAKTPGWAAGITGAPEDVIVRLAREIGQAKPAFISQGLGPQRHANGEQTARAICLLAILTGNVGIAGGNTGAGESGASLPWVGFPTLDNPIRTAISMFMWTAAIERGPEMTATRDGVRGAERLTVPVKFIWNYAGNALVNQHSDTGRTRRILEDETRCEMIVVIEHFMTASARYADILLPAVTSLEENDIALSDGASSEMAYAIFCQKAVEPPGECRSVYDIAAGVARRLGLEERFCEGRTRDQWLRYLLAESRRALPDLPATLEEGWRTGVYRRRIPACEQIALHAFRHDPDAHPLETPSGRIEIFSRSLWRIARTWKLPPGERIPALPEFVAEREGHLDPLQQSYPLQMVTHHAKQRTHSTYGNVEWLAKAASQRVWINPLDAAVRGIAHGQRVAVHNARGRLELPAKVTVRIMPGVVSLPQGAWYRPDAAGVDHGGCANTLTSLHPSPLAKGNPQHSNLVEVTPL